MVSFFHPRIILGTTLLTFLTGCGFTMLKQKDNSETEESTDTKTIKSLDENGLSLEAYDASLWGFIVNANSLKSQPSTNIDVAIQAEDQATASPQQTTAPIDGVNQDAISPPPQSKVDPTTAPDQQPKQEPVLKLTDNEVPVDSVVDDSLIADDDQSVYDAPAGSYQYIAVRKCLRLTTIIEDGLTAEGIYCLKISPADNQQCRDPKKLIRGPDVRKSLNQITDNNLDLANVLTGKLGFNYDSVNRQWSKASDGILIKISPLRIAALSLENPCGTPGNGGSSDGGGDGGNVDDGIGGVTARINMSSRLAIPRKIAIDSSNRTVIAASSAGTNSQYSMLIGRFLPDNTPDPTFGSNGFTELTDLPGVSAGYTVKIDEKHNRIFVSGYQNNEWERVIVALTPDGQLDLSWGEKGVVVRSGMNINFELDAEGRIYTLSNAVVQRLAANGSLDTTFGVAGELTFDTEKPEMYNVDFLVKGDNLHVLGEIGNRNEFGFFTLNLSDKTQSLQVIRGAAGDDMQSIRLAAGPERIMVFGRKISAGGGDGFFVSAFKLSGEPDINFANAGMLSSEDGSSQDGLVFDSPDSFWITGWNGIRKYNLKGEQISVINQDQFYLSADWLAMGTDGSLVGASIAHGGGELFRLPADMLTPP